MKVNAKSILIRSVSPFDEQVSKMIDSLDEYQRALYPPESNHLDSRQTLSEANCNLVGAYDAVHLIGIGAVKIVQKYGELKRFYIPEAQRGKGVGELILQELELWLYRKGIDKCYLETGIYQYAAIKFYEKCGYKKTLPFGPYLEDPLSVFMKKELKFN